MAGFENDIGFAKNFDFTQADNQAPAEANGLATNGQLWIGTTAVNAGGTHINVGELISPDNSIAFGYSSPNITASAGTAMGTVKTLTPNEDFDGSAATPISGTAGNINTFGVNPSFATVTETLNSTGASTGNLQIEHRAWVSGLVVDTSTTPGSRGTYSTLTAALAAATAGQTVFLRTSVTENVTLPAGVNIAGWTGGTLNTPTITGTITMTAAGTCNISGIRLQTNSAAALAVTGSAASIVNLENCYLNFTNNTGITFSSSDSGARINIYNCRGNLGTTGIALFAHSSAGIFLIAQSDFTNTGLSTQANTVSSGTLGVRKSLITNPTTTSSTSAFIAETSAFSTEAQNVTALTIGGSNSQELYFCGVAGGSASAITISSALTISLSDVSSTNTNAITGAGAIDYYGIAFSGTSTTINTTTKTIAGTLQGSKNTAPTAGFLGEQIRSYVATGSAVSVATSTATNVTSISLTPGVWDVTCNCVYKGITTGSIAAASISTVSATQGTTGDNTYNNVLTSTTASDVCFIVPPYRITLSATTTVYMVAVAIYTVGAALCYGRLSATRVG